MPAAAPYVWSFVHLREPQPSLKILPTPHNQVHAFLERLEALVATGQRKHADTVARILPFLAAGDQGALRALADHFLPRLDLAAFDALQEAERGECAPARLLRDVFVKVMESIPQSAAGWRLQVRTSLQCACIGVGVRVRVWDEVRVGLGFTHTYTHTCSSASTAVDDADDEVYPARIPF